MSDPGSSDPTVRQPGTFYVGDVGWYAFEELNIVKGSGNFGWPCEEGKGSSPDYPEVTETFTGNENVLCDALDNPENPLPNTTPSFWWRGEGADSNPPGWEGYSSTGGTSCDGTTFPPEYHGTYLHADFAREWLRVVEVDANDDITGWSEFGEDLGYIVGVYVEPETRDMLHVDWVSGQINRISHSNPIGIDEAAAPSEIEAFTVVRNPFRTNTTISFRISAASPVTMNVHDVGGRHVRTLVDRRYAKGRHFVVWDGTDETGHPAASGVYFVGLRVNGQPTATRRVVRLPQGAAHARDFPRTRLARRVQPSHRPRWRTCRKRSRWTP